jgi:hypothetical protein
MMRHEWKTVTETPLLIEQICSRCELRRWRRPGSATWNFGYGDGKWVELAEPPTCWPTRGEAA